jgi:hypothetical protein
MTHDYHVPSAVPRWFRAPRARALFLLLSIPSLFGCDDDLFQVKWEISPDTVLLYSLARPELNLLSAFDFVSEVPVPVESPNATGEWDMALDTQDGGLVFLPPGAVGISDSKARIIPMGTASFEELRQAPSDTTLYVGDRAVPVVLGNTYIIRTRQKRGIYGQVCVYYGKFEPLFMDVVAGTLTFMYDVSPVCNSRKLVPTNN